MLVQSHSPLNQVLYLTPRGIPTSGLLLMVPVESLDRDHVILGQLRPPLVRLVPAATVTGLGLDGVNWTHHLKISERDTGTERVNAVATWADEADGAGSLTYTLQSGDLVSLGVHDFQFRSVRTSDSRVMYWERERMVVRSQ